MVVMKTVIFSDSDSKTELSENLKAGIVRVLTQNGNQVQVIELEKDHVVPCLGCFLCATRHRGECVSRDTVGEIRRDIQQLGMTVFVTPVIFGHFSSTIKNAVDRGTGSREWQVVIGYGSDIDHEEKSTFIDLTAKHRGSADIVHPGMDSKVDVYFTQSLEENAAICESLKRDLPGGWQA
jgi:NADPH-dependent FMN reductase